MKEWTAEVVVDALIAHHAKRLAASPGLKLREYAAEMGEDESLLSRWLRRITTPRGRNLDHLAQTLHAKRALRAPRKK